MLILTVLLIFSVLLNRGSTINLKYIVRNDGDKLIPSCIGENNERYEGIGWTFPISNDGEIPKEESYYLPKIKNDYNCKFSYNEHCSKIWSMRNWDIDSNSARINDFITDERWENFPTYFTSNKTKFKERIELLPNFKLGISLRASENAEILICEGWDPEKYSCYHFNITNKHIYLTKHLTMSEKDRNSTKILDSYQVFSNIITIDEWRNFQISNENGTIILEDVNLKRKLIEKTVDYPLKPAYLFFGSEKPSLWKIHQNNFFYTKTAQISRLGPRLELNTENLCINLYVSSCENCTLTFFTIENTTKISIDQKVLRKNGEWSLIRLSKEKINANQLNILLQTSFKGKDEKNGFWAIDDVRVCHKNEIKVNLLKLDIPKGKSNEVSCQIVDKPNLRPVKKLYDHVKEFPTITSESDSTSINLTWTPENLMKNVEYFINYQASDICTEKPFNPKRLKSNGFVVTKSNRLSLKDLIPYTSYNITFSTMLHLKEKSLIINTKYSPYISFEEQPNNIKIEDITEKSVKIIWDKVNCKNIYGHIIYNLELIENGNIINLGSQTDHFRIITDLKPFTFYILNIGVSRDIIKNEKMKKFIKLSFTTKPGLAQPPNNVEIYSSSNNSLSIRYNVQDNNGHPTELHISRCSSLMLKKCKTLQLPVEPCKLFDGKYCAKISNLIPNQKQSLHLSLKNDGSHTFGEETTIEGFTEEHVPGKPTNITYKLIDCTINYEFCNVNITWLHPYYQNGEIKSFNMILKKIDETGNEINKEIMNKSLIINGNYLPKYNYLIKHVPFSSKYNLYLQSINEDYKSDLTTKTVIHTINLGDKIDQSPKLIETKENSVEFELKPTDIRLLTTLTVIVQDFNKSMTIDRNILKQIDLIDNLCNNKYGNTWISQKIQINNSTKKIKIGELDQSGKSLKPSTNYCITFLMENKRENSTHKNVYYEKFTTKDIPESDGSMMNLILIILIGIVLIILIISLIWYVRMRKTVKNRRLSTRKYDENEYESLPFEDTIVNNNMYDRLQHK